MNTRPLKFHLKSIYCLLIVLSVWCLCHWHLYYLIFMVFLSLKKILFLYCLISLLFFSLTNIIFSTILKNATKCIPGTICNVTILYPGETRKYFSRDISPFHNIHICYRVCPASHTLGIRGCFTDRTVQHLLHKTK